MASDSFLKFNQVDFSYDAHQRPIFKETTLHFASGWTGLVGPNEAGKTTLLLLACGHLKPDRGQVSGPALTWYCEQRTDRPPREANAFMAALDGEAQIIKSTLDLDQADLERWPTLSHGERKRFQIGTALYARPDVLALDEPTNHLDREAQDQLYRALKNYRGVGLLVSHDRDLLDRLCEQCVFIDPPRAIMRPGNYSAGAEQARIERAGLKSRREKAEARATGLRRVENKRRGQAARSVRINPKRGLSRKDSDAREKADRARVTGRDAARGRLLGQVQGRLAQARRELEAAPFIKEHPAGISVLGQISPRRFLFNLPGGTLPLGDAGTLSFPELSLRPQDRIALVGPNGSGKSTLMERLYSSLNLPESMVVYIPQEAPVETSEKILVELEKIPSGQRGWLMNIISRLGSRPERLLDSRQPSPGETRKLLLALGLLREPWLVMMDEPTNHLDLFSMERLEAGLGDFQGALLLVSHDQKFLRSGP